MKMMCLSETTKVLKRPSKQHFCIVVHASPLYDNCRLLPSVLPFNHSYPFSHFRVRLVKQGTLDPKVFLWVFTTFTKHKICKHCLRDIAVLWHWFDLCLNTFLLSCLQGIQGPSGPPGDKGIPGEPVWFSMSFHTSIFIFFTPSILIQTLVFPLPPRLISEKPLGQFSNFSWCFGTDM